MKRYMEVGERGYYDKKRYRCVPASFMGCEKCDLLEYVGTPLDICDKVLCMADERPDGIDIIFRIQPKYHKK